MAGETPQGHEASKNLKRKRLAHLDDKSTNKIYASGQRSALEGTQSGEGSKDGAQPIQNTPLRRDERMADKYYRSTAQAPTAQQAAQERTKQEKREAQKTAQEATRQARQQRVPAREATPTERKLVRRAPATPEQHQQLMRTPHGITIERADQVRGAMAEIVARLHNGHTHVAVYIPKGDSALLRRTRAALEMLVTREEITEDQYRDVRLSWTADANPAPVASAPALTPEELAVPPQPRGERVVDDQVAHIDPAAFLAGDGSELTEPTVDVSAQPAQALAVDASGAAHAVEDDDNDFLVPAAPTEAPVTETPVVETPVVETPVAEAPADAAPVAETPVAPLSFAPLDAPAETPEPVAPPTLEDSLAAAAALPGTPPPAGGTTAPRAPTRRGGRRSGRGS